MGKNPNEEDSERLGVGDFLNFMYDGQPEWSLFAVEAPIDEVSNALADLRDASNRMTDVPRRASKSQDDVEPLVAVVQVKGNPWTIVLRSLFEVQSSDLEGVEEDAKAISSELKAKAICFTGEDTSGAMAYALFENGSTLERAEWEAGGEFHTFKSSQRKKPALDEVDDDFVDEVFRNLGIYVPCCFPTSEGGHASLAVEKGSENIIQRADLIELEEEESDEELDEEEDED